MLAAVSSNFGVIRDPDPRKISLFDMITVQGKLSRGRPPSHSAYCQRLPSPSDIHTHSPYILARCRHAVANIYLFLLIMQSTIHITFRL